MVYADGTAPIFARDRNGDGDFDDVGETIALDSAQPSACDVESDAELAVAQNADGSLRLLVDRNGDEDFDDTDENIVLRSVGTGIQNVEIAFGAGGRVLVATDDEILVDTLP